MPAPPLTHHDILALVEPFARRGRHVDPGACNRIERRIAFQPLEHPAGAAPGSPALRETLQLESFASGSFRLTRTLVPATGGPAATLQASGRQPAELLALVESVAPARQFQAGEGFVIARSLRFDAGSTQALLARGVAQFEGLSLTLTLPAARGVAADLLLQATGADAFDLPEDLLAVQGWDWARLARSREGWKSKLRLRGAAARRSARAEAALDLAAAHLTLTLAEPPGRFHERHVAARWGVVLRRSIPLLTTAALFVSVVLLPRFDLSESRGLWTLMYQVPTALLALAFCLQEMPQFEIPPRPRRSAAASWRVPHVAAGGALGGEAGRRRGLFRWR